MYKILLADDDYHVLEYLRKMIPWEALGFEVVGYCADGQEALHEAREHRPDVIMTDIGMPRMDGITLIKRVREEDPGIKSIFLTCYDDFKYAQEAIRLGSFDYILKETMDHGNISEMMERLKKELDQAKINQAVVENMKFLIKENLIVLRSKLLERLLSGDQPAINRWLKQHEQELEIDASYEDCIPILSFIDNYEELVEERFSEDTLKFAADNIISETLGCTGKGFCLFHQDDTFFIFYAKGGYISEEEIQQVIRDINANLRRYLKLSSTALYGRSCKFPDGLIGELQDMLAASVQRFYLPPGSIAKAGELQFSAMDPAEDMEKHEEVKRLILREDQAGIEAWVERWESCVSEHQVHPDSVKKWVLSLLLEVEKMVQALQDFETDSIDPAVHHAISQAKTMRQLAARLLDTLSQYAARMKEINRLPKKAEIISAQKYVLLNLDKKITLGEVAKHLHLNPSYFSRIYKQHTGMNFIDYVNQMKMEEAKRLLDQTSESVEAIAEKLGFDSKGYFLKVFKKYYGISPVEYRQGVRAD